MTTTEEKFDAESIGSKERTQSEMIFRRFFRHRMAVFGLFLFAAVILYAYVGPLLWKYGFTIEPGVSGGQQPSLEHPFGTDTVGKDMFGTVMKATQTSLGVAFISAIGTAFLGAVTGAVAGYFRGKTDAIIMRVVDLLFVLPFLVVTGAIAGNVKGGTSWITMALIITAFGWLGTARAVRAEVMSLREKEFIEAAKAVGAPDMKIIFRHLIPNTMSVIIVSATLQIAFAILAESTLSYLGLGIQPPDTSLGLLIQQSGGNAFSPEAYLFYIPGVFIIIIALSVNFIGDGLRDAMDPRQSMVRR